MQEEEQEQEQEQEHQRRHRCDSHDTAVLHVTCDINDQSVVVSQQQVGGLYGVIGRAVRDSWRSQGKERPRRDEGWMLDYGLWIG